MSDGSYDGAWFRPKQFGYGATPATWQGWVATLVFVVVFVATMGQLNAGGPGLAGWNWALHGHLHHSLADLLGRPDVLGEAATELIAFLVLVRWKTGAR